MSWAARDSNPQRRQPTDLQSAPALQLRRPPGFINEQQIYCDFNKNANKKCIEKFEKIILKSEKGKIIQVFIWRPKNHLTENL